MTARATTLRPQAVGSGAIALAAAGIASVAVALLAGVWAGRLLAPDEPAPAAGRVVRAGEARLTVPVAWRPMSPSDAGVAGLDARSAVAFAPPSGGAGRMIATVAPADDASLIAPALRALLAAPPPPPRAARLARLPAWRYPRLATRLGDRTIDLTVLPTTRGVLSVACVSPAAGTCASAVESASVAGAAALVPSASVALAHRLPAVLDRLDRARVERRAALRRARTPAAQATAARGLAREHLAAGESVRAAAGVAGGRLVMRLAAVGGAYGALALAADEGSGERFGAARREVAAAEAGLASAVRAVRRHGPRQVVTAASAPGPVSDATAGSSTTILTIAAIMLGLGIGVASAIVVPPRAARPAGRRSVDVHGMLATVRAGWSRLRSRDPSPPAGHEAARPPAGPAPDPEA